MTAFKFTYTWQDSEDRELLYRYTMADLALHIGKVNLFRNENVWLTTIQESALLSAYPLAMWLAFSWWRLNYEPLPAEGSYPSVDWRMAHELGASDHGFVWPRIIFASDGEIMQIWAVPLNDGDNQSIRYLNGLEPPAYITLADFQRETEAFIHAVCNRLNANRCQNTELESLWQLILNDQCHPEHIKYRSLEAKMGYDPDECPEELIEEALSLEMRMGENAFSELAPVYGKSAMQTPLAAIQEIADGNGLIGVPAISTENIAVPKGMPWQRGVAVARELRQMLGSTHNAINNVSLCELLGLKAAKVDEWSPNKRHDVAMAIPSSERQFKFIPRKKHPSAKRFELARFIGDYILTESTIQEWLTSTDLRTSRQKYQRAFASEFLCPIAGLQEFLQEDFSQTAIEDAADHFQVSEKTVASLLFNNHLIPYDHDARLPYHLSF